MTTSFKEKELVDAERTEPSTHARAVRGYELVMIGSRVDG